MNLKDIVKNFLKIFVSFCFFYFVLFLFNRTLYHYISLGFSYSKYGISLAFELIAFFILFLFLLLIGKKKIFLEKREPFFKSVGLGIPILIFTVILLIAGIGQILRDGSIHLPNLFVSFFLCLFIGLFEECLCRGWLLNSFLDKIGKKRKGVLLSIVLSGLIFGCLHLTNLLAGQSLFMTIIQVAQSFMIGMVLGIIYYRTKNIWSVAFLHAFYDFASFLSDVNLLKDCHFISNLPTSYYVYMIFSTIIICSFYFLSFLILSRKTKINDLVEEKEEITSEDTFKDERKKLLCSISMIAVWLLQSLVPMQFDMQEIEVCYSYEEREKIEHISSFYTFSSYTFSTSFLKEIESSSFQDLFQNETISSSYSLSLEEGDLVIRTSSLEKVLDNNVLQTVFYEEETRFVLYYLKDVQNNSTIYYLSIPKDDLNEDYEILAYIDHHAFTSYVLPDVVRLGTYKEKNGNFSYPYLVTTAQDEFVITEDNHLYVLKK